MYTYIYIYIYIYIHIILFHLASWPMDRLRRKAENLDELRSTQPETTVRAVGDGAMVTIRTHGGLGHRFTHIISNDIHDF